MPIERDIKVKVTAYDIGEYFARADSAEQAAILYWIASELQHVHSKDYSPYAVQFCFQAREIANSEHINRFPAKKQYLINVLQDLIDHLTEQS